MRLTWQTHLTYVFKSLSVGTWKRKKNDIDVTKHRLDTVPQLLPCHTLICILLRLCLQAPRSCQAAVRKRAAGSQSCGWGGRGGRVRAQTTARWKRSAKINGESSAREAREGERGRRAEIKTTKLHLDKELGSPSQTASNLQRLNWPILNII